jgi:ubiquinone/menaquinone biosynthesis C-methylase UbiE
MFSKEYWNERAERFGHTGHSEPFYYCFDQQARLHSINEHLLTFAKKKGKALDFGCGSGDFIPLLNKHFKTVYGFDISDTVITQTRKRFDQQNVILSDKHEDILEGIKFDLILSVTVLQTFCKEQLEDTLAALSNSLMPNGIIIAMEFFTTAQLNLTLHESKATTDEWLALLQKYHLKIIARPGFINPHIAPSKSWISYNNSLFLKVLKLIKRTGFAQKQFTRYAIKTLQHYNDTTPENNSHLSIYIIQKEITCN